MNVDRVVVEYAMLGRNEEAAAEMMRRFDNAPFWKQRELRTRLAQAVELFNEARARNDRLGIYRP